MQTDDYDEVAETNEFNNLNYVDIYIDGPADLLGKHLEVLENVSEDIPLSPGEVFTVKYEVVNKGGEDVPFSATHFYLFTEDYLNENQPIFGTIEVKDIDNEDLYVLYGDQFSEIITLGPDDSTGKQEINLEVPHDINPGKYFLGMQNDVYDEVQEPNEFNNSLFGIGKDYVEVFIGGKIIAGPATPNDPFDPTIVMMDPS